MDITIGCQFEYFNELGLPLERLLVITQKTKGFLSSHSVSKSLGRILLHLHSMWSYNPFSSQRVNISSGTTLHKAETGPRGQIKKKRESLVNFGKTEFLSKITSRNNIEMRIQDADKKLDEITFQFSFTV